MKGLISARAQLERVLSLHDSVLKCIKNDRKIQDMGQKMYIFTFHTVKITRRVPFFSSKISMITNVILVLYNSSINNKLILRDLRFRHHIACFCSISPTKNNFRQLQRCFKSQWFVPEWFNRLNDSVQSQWFVPEWFNRLNDSVQSQRLTCYPWRAATCWRFNFTF